MLNFIDKKRSLASFLCLTFSLFGWNVLGAIAQSSEQSLSNSLPQNKNNSKIVEIGRLSTGERVLEVPKEFLSQSAFKEALQRPLYINPKLDYSRDGQAIINNPNKPRLFLWDGNRLTFVGYGISSIQEFKIGNETYWASLCSDYTLCYDLFISRRNLESLTPAKGIDKLGYLQNIRKDATQEGFFYIEAHIGNGLMTETITYLVNLSLTVTNPNQSVVVCKVSKYTNLRNGRRSPVIENPDCQTGRQVASIYTAISSTPLPSSSMKQTDTISKYPTNEQSSQRFPTDKEVRTLLQKLKKRIIQNPKYIDRSRRDFSLETFTRAWAKSDPSASYFLGEWDSQEDAIMIYPTSTQGKVCVIWTLPAGSVNGRPMVTATFNIGFVSKEQLKVNNIFFDKGKAVIIRDGNYLLIASVDRDSPQLSTYSGFSLPLQSLESLPLANTSENRRVIQQFNDAGCTTSLPNKVSPQIPVVATYRNVREFGLAQLTGTDKKLTSVYESLTRASQDKYAIPVDTSSIDFLKKPIATLYPSDCQVQRITCDQKDISFADYLQLKQKVAQQAEVYKSLEGIANNFTEYKKRLYNDTRNNGRNVFNQIEASLKKILEDTQSKTQLSRLSNSEIIKILASNVLDSGKDTALSIIKTNIKIAGAISQLEELVKSFSNLSPNDVNKLFGTSNYVFESFSNIQDAGQALLKSDSDKVSDATLKTVQNTIEYIDLQNTQVSKSGNVIKLYLAAKDYIAQDKLFKQPQILDKMDKFDKFYLSAAQFSKGVEIVLAGLSIPLSSKKADSLLKKGDALNILLFDALESAYKNDLRTKYAKLLYAYNRNKMFLKGELDALNMASDSVGNYLITARKDVVNRRQDGSVTVNKQGIIYPP
jgi:hypothetical protein